MIEIEEVREHLKKDEYGFYIHADNYRQCFDNYTAWLKFQDKEKLERIPKWIRIIFNAI